MKRFAICVVTLTLLFGASSANPGVRHETALALSAQAEAYYTGVYTYEALSALSGSASSNSAEAWSSPLCAALRRLMTETVASQPSYVETLLYFPQTDASGGGSQPLRFYRDDCGSYNREQVWADSHGVFDHDGAGSDLHHLRPADPEANSVRGSMTFGNVRDRFDSWETWPTSGEPVFWYVPEWDGGNGLVEVRDGVKGDVARILLYVYVTYGEESGGTRNLWTDLGPAGSGALYSDGHRVIESLDTLLAWMELDPVDTWELGRNDVVQDLQGNRNVFIDYPELAFLLFDREIPDMQSPSGAAHSPHCDFTAVAVPPEGGSLTVTGHQVTAQPAPGWEVESWSLSPAEAGVVTADSSTLTLSIPHGPCTLTVRFASNDPCALGHDWDRGYLTRIPTKTLAGEKTYTCSRCGTTRTEPVPFRFTDVANESAYYFLPVYWALSHDPRITDGTGDTTFSPGLGCTRAQVLTFLWRAVGCPEPALANMPFRDVHPGDYFYKPVLWALENGVTTGTSETMFSPYAVCARAQVVTFLWHVLGEPATEYPDPPFRDVPDNAYYRQAVTWAAERGITSGSGEGCFAPDAPCTRAQVVTMLWRAFSGE